MSKVIAAVYEDFLIGKITIYPDGTFSHVSGLSCCRIRSHLHISKNNEIDGEFLTKYAIVLMK